MLVTNTSRGIIAMLHSPFSSGPFPNCTPRPTGTDEVSHQCMNNNKFPNIQKENTNNNSFKSHLEKKNINNNSEREHEW